MARSLQEAAAVLETLWYVSVAPAPIPDGVWVRAVRSPPRILLLLLIVISSLGIPVGISTVPVFISVRLSGPGPPVLGVGGSGSPATSGSASPATLWDCFKPVEGRHVLTAGITYTASLTAAGSCLCFRPARHSCLPAVHVTSVLFPTVVVTPVPREVFCVRWPLAPVVLWFLGPGRMIPVMSVLPIAASRVPRRRSLVSEKMQMLSCSEYKNTVLAVSF